MSDDGKYALVLIAFIGSVFSPVYFRTRDLESTGPYDHCAVNVALYGPGARRWAFTEYRSVPAQFKPGELVIGPNTLSWGNAGLACSVAETGAPFPWPIHGSIRLHPEFSTDFVLALDRSGQHCWQPIAPRAAVEIDLQRPALRWRGTGYMDTNWGVVPLDEGMRFWSWQRAHSSRETKIIYDIHPVDGPPVPYALDVSRTGRILQAQPPPRIDLPGTLWRMRREARTDSGSTAQVLATLEDSPFYSRTLLQTVCGGERVAAIHESLSLERFRSAWVRALLPFRIRRSRR